MSISTKDTIYTSVPGQDPIPLIEYYEDFRGYYPNCELNTKTWFVDNIQRDWVILDCGANIGYYSVLFSRQAPAGHVYAIEPTSTADMLRKNLAHNQTENVSVHEIALGRQTGDIQDGIFRVWGREAETQTYPFMTLDAFVEQNAIPRVDCIKIDVDSFDLEVLQGSVRTMRDYNPWIVVELNHALAVRQQSVPEALFWLNEQGYDKALVVDNENFVLKRGVDPTEKATQSLTLFR